jgi:hypothetical protein
MAPTIAYFQRERNAYARCARIVKVLQSVEDEKIVALAHRTIGHDRSTWPQIFALAYEIMARRRMP